MKIYYGRNRLENWFSELERPEVFYGSISFTKQATKQATKQSISTAPQNVAETLSQPEFNYRRVVGANMVRAGVTILMVPDPIPLVDEIVGFGLIAIGGYLVYS